MYSYAAASANGVTSDPQRPGPEQRRRQALRLRCSSLARRHTGCAGLCALGHTVDGIRDFYLRSGAEIFHKARLWERFRTKFESDELSEMLRDVSGEDTTLGSEKLRTLLMMVLRNATTDSPWPLTNNPAAKYNDAARADCNLK